jgi:hypothetical protein
MATNAPLKPLKRVGTHNGSFHCDEALGCFMIRLTDKFSNAEIVRTRDAQVRFPKRFPVWLPRKLWEKKSELKEKVGVFFFWGGGGGGGV